MIFPAVSKNMFLHLRHLSKTDKIVNKDEIKKKITRFEYVLLAYFYFYIITILYQLIVK